MTPLRIGRRWPLGTAAVLAATVVLTVLQYPFPEVRLALWRDPHALASGQWWRLVTPLLVQYDAVWQIVVVLTLIAGIGVLAERGYGHGRFLLLLGFGLGALLLWRDRRLSPVAASRAPQFPAGRGAELGAGVDDTPPPEGDPLR